MTQPVRRPIWTNLDVFGLLNGFAIWDSQYKDLKYVRKPYENNLELRNRIINEHYYKSDVNKQGLLNALCNEFELIPYNVTEKKIFELSYIPISSGSVSTQDIFGFYKNLEGEWINIGPQFWSESYISAKNTNNGFIVWQNNRVSTISGYKNFEYSNLVEIFREFDDNTELKFIYYVEGIDSNNNKILMRYTDMNDSGNINDQRFTYKKQQVENIDISGNIILYTLNDIPEQLKNTIYYDLDTGMSYNFLYDLKKYIDNKFKHTWNKITTNSCIWDIHKNYGSGHIPSFYDSIVPNNFDNCSIRYSGYIGGIESLSYSLYPSEIVEQTGVANEWYLKIYPGKFYIDGISFYYFENPQVSNLDFTLISTGDLSGSYETSIPSGLSRGMYTILAKSGYYDNYCNIDRDEFLSGVYEDYSYHTGIDGDSFWSNILNKVPYLTANMGYDYPMKLGDYCIDFRSKKIYAKIPSSYKQLTIIWDNILTSSGTLLYYDLNPLNDQNLTFEKFFLYLTLNTN